MEDVLTITKEQFYRHYKPQKNHLDDTASWDGHLYENFGPEADYCYELNKIEDRVWTIIECVDYDPEEDRKWEEENFEPACLYILSGFHIVDSIGFLVTKNPYLQDTEVKLEL